ncbi:putative 50S ribosomal protein L18, chloroplastic-like isoform X1 [Capsicum annuum]|uniref:pentatricopeptide repeat-containing protein At5g61990, mitochondrial isoform X1 n=1 Tax=Capsicum annuum TaxID=4072 RepID=UPI0007BEB5D1|nr:pentatricopeptide repeat-containing protein At5g61990, mitochondrial isoform X1 [Capsicum annuum]KAF3612383.1 putative 50S ribosomal protein L18, chloroplastic-like isoform X1 [Capsicum annuum]KAF3614079.1 putative 50S ribosomal protein L18, chloroplastic-like isoform X1 [Capsicum annuum]
MWRVFHRKITRCIEQTTFHRHNCNSQLPQNNQILVQELTQILKNKKWKRLIQSSGLKKKLNPDVVRSILHQHQLTNHLERLLSFFQWSKHKVGIQSDLEIHSFLAVLLCSNNLYGPASSVLDIVIKFGLPPLDVVKSIDNCRKELDESRKFDHIIFGLLMDKYREKKYLFEAASVIFAHNKDLDCVPSLFCCNRLLTDLLKDSNFRLFWRVTNSMSEANITFNAITYTSMVDAHCREGNFSDAKKVLAEMEEKGFCSNMFTYNILMKGLFRAEHVDEAIQLKKSMFAKSLVPNRYIYTTFIDGLCAANRFKEAIMVFAEMTERGVKLDSVVYEALLDSYLRDDVDEAFKMKDIKDAKGIDLNLCNTLLRGLCKCGMMEKAHKLVGDMTGEGIKPDLTTYTLLIEGHCQGGNVATALELLEELKKKNLASVESTYCIITDCLCRNKDTDSAMSSLSDLITKNGKQNALTWRTLFKNYSRKGYLEQLRRILEAIDVR